MNSSKRFSASSFHRALARRYGPQHWWPARTAFEVAVGAVLVQNTAWANVEKAIAGLRRRRLLTPAKLHAAPVGLVARVIRPSGTYRVKARRLKALVAWWIRRDGALDDVHGIGPETADSIRLYAFGEPRFVIDAYTRRVLSRHGLARANAPYAELQRLFESSLPRDARLFNEFHALLVAVGKEHCRATPRCESCPLRKFLP
jgi:endonuclease-3 related protein